MQMKLQPETPVEIHPGIRAVFQKGALVLELSDEEGATGREQMLRLYDKIIQLVYGAESVTELKSSVEKFNVDRVKQALFWETNDGKKLYLFPTKGADGKIFRVKTWLE